MNILILVHPDCLSEQYVYTPAQAEEYLEKLEQHLPKFDNIFVLRMERVTEEWIASVNTEIQQHFAKLKEILERHADLQIFDNDLARTSLNQEIGEFLLEHPNSTLYLSGGYQDNCLRLVADNLVEELGDFIKELGIRVKIYTPLVYYSKKGLGFEEVKKPLPWWDKDWIEQYQEDQKKKREERSYRDWADEAPIGREDSRGDWWEGPTEKLAFLTKRLRMMVSCLRKKATKEYFDEQEMIELLSHGIPDLKIEKNVGDKRDFTGTKELELPFAYGEIPNYINPADDMGWDVIALPSAVGLPKEKLVPVGILRYNRDVDFWNTLPGDDPIGNDKIILGKRTEGVVGDIRGEYTKEDLEILSSFVKDNPSFEKPEFLWDYV